MATVVALCKGSLKFVFLLLFWPLWLPYRIAFELATLCRSVLQAAAATLCKYVLLLLLCVPPVILAILSDVAGAWCRRCTEPTRDWLPL